MARNYIQFAAEKNPVVYLEMETEPTNTQYAGKDIDLTGMKINAVRLDGTKEDVTSKVIKNREKWGSVSVSQVVRFGYKNAGYDWKVTPEAIVPVSAVIKTPAEKTTYEAGEDVDLTGLVLTVTYNDATEKDVSEGFEASPEVIAADTTAITVSYTEGGETVSVSYDITVTEPVAPDEDEEETT